MRGFLNDIAKMFMDMAMKIMTNKAVLMLIEFFASSMGGSSGPTQVSGPYLHAQGGVFSSSGLSPYLNSVVSKPTLFAFAKGVGLMGEAGSEAIMPLTRTANGDLGVKSVGGSGINMTVNINNSDEQGVLKALPQMRQMILDTVNSEIGSNGSTIQMIRRYA